MPEVISYLNGVIVHGTLSMKNLFIKFISLTLAVSSGLPTAIQGPMIAIGYVLHVFVVLQLALLQTGLHNS